MTIHARDLTPMADDALVLASRVVRALRQKREKESKMQKLSEEQKNLLGAVAWGRALAERDLQPLKLAYLEGLTIKTAEGAAAWLQKLEGLGIKEAGNTDDLYSTALTDAQRVARDNTDASYQVADIGALRPAPPVMDLGSNIDPATPPTAPAPSLSGVGLPDDPAARAAAVDGLTPKTSSLSSAFLDYAAELPAEKRAGFLKIATTVNEAMNRATLKVLAAMRGAR